LNRIPAARKSLRLIPAGWAKTIPAGRKRQKGKKKAKKITKRPLYKHGSIAPSPPYDPTRAGQGPGTFDFITGEWLRKFLNKARAGTAVDQWGPCDFGQSGDMDSISQRRRSHHEQCCRVDNIARLLIRPVAAG
jgi:hypothetical protein